MARAAKCEPKAPPRIAANAGEAAKLDDFLLPGEFCDARFVRRSDILFVTFDNLASVGEYDPPQPWLDVRTAKNGFSILGIMAKRKDWYRNASGPELLTGLRDAGFFEGFRRVVFTGASMGGFAAISLSSIVPGSTVIAFSPQSTLSRDIAPFEKRYRYAHRKWDWTSPEFLDAADAVPHAEEIFLFYDPFVPEDRAHADRLQGPSVRLIKCGHFGHRLIRQLKTCGALDAVFRDVGRGSFDEAAFRKSLRKRREVRPWKKELLGNLLASGHQKLALRASETFLADEPGAKFARKVVDEAAQALAASTNAATSSPEPAEPTDASVEKSDLVSESVSKNGPFKSEILELSNAIVVPERNHDRRLASGVLLSDRSYCELSRAWIRAGKSTPVPSLSSDEKIERLEGRHMFAGHMRGHFGHFLVESTARLWALDRLHDQIDSVLYLPYRGSVKQTRRALSAHKNFFELLDIKVPIQTHGTAIEVEHLIVPELGFGWKERYAGSQGYRSFMRDRLGENIAPDGGENLYISRAQLGAQRGGVLGETVIEDNLRLHGYEVFYPEQHPIEVQIARYRAAKRIVALDGSALHLAAFVMPKGGKVGIILRRSNANVADYVLQYQSFCGITPDVIDVIRKDWVSADVARSDYRSVGELDFGDLFSRLKWFGYVPPEADLRLPDKDAVSEMLMAFSERRGEEFTELPTS